MAEVALENVTMRFGNAVAVEDMDLAIADGELLVLLGPTGAGKTTTLRVIAGLEKPSSGRVIIGGADVTAMQPASRNVAMVFQEYSLYPHYTVYDNLAFPLRAPLRRMGEDVIKEKVTNVARLLRIESKLANKSTALSGGEMQRVAIGRALVRQPSVFLMDEPLSSLDAKLRDDLRVELKRIQMDLGATILYVTHDQIEAMTLADRIGVLSEGRLLQIGSPREIYRQPNSIYVACRLGSPRINLLPPGALGVEGGPSGAETMGIRPENIVLGNQGIPTNIKSVERLGNETVVHLEIEGQKLLALAPPGQRFQADQQVSVNSLPGSALYFDQAGQRIN